MKDGKHKIRIAICHKQETCYIVTRFIIDDLSQFKNGQVVKRADAAIINTKLRTLLNEYQEKHDNIQSISMYNCQQSREMLVNSTLLDKVSTFQAVSKSYIEELIEEKRNSYATLLERNCRCFSEYTKGDFLLSGITPQLISGYSKFLRSTKKMGETSIDMMMARTRVIVNLAIKTQLVRYDIHSFANYSIASALVSELDLPLNSFNKIRNVVPQERKYKVAHDLFCLSFYLYGINLIDLLEIDFRGISLKELQANEYFSKRSLVRKKFQGVNGWTLSSEDYSELLKIINAKRFNVDILPRLYAPELPEILSIIHERDVETQLLEPLLNSMGWHENKDFIRQLPIHAGRGHRIFPDGHTLTYLNRQ